MRQLFSKSSVRNWGAPALVALAACCAVLTSIDPAGDYPSAPQGPGLTVDEIFNMQEGVRLVEGWRALALGAISLRELYGDERILGNQRPPLGYHFPDHPPLGRIWLGVFHQLTRAIVPPRDHQTFFVTACARVGSATAFGLTVFLVGWVATRWYGFRGGLVASVALALMPRVFGHAHLAALESTTGLAYLAAALAVAARWTPASSDVRPIPPPAPRAAALAGLLFGLALLTKIQGILLTVPVALWALWHWRKRAIVPLVVWGVVGLCVFFVGWPWLWFDPVGHFLEYLGRTTDRMGVNAWYLGRKFVDRDVPWHYPAVMFLVTVPVGLHALGAWGLFCGERPAWKEPREQALLACLLFPIALFSYSHIVVYDGERLFLVAFPLWAMLIGRGGASLWNRLERLTSRRVAASLAAVFLALQGYGLWVYAPCHLSYYNLLVGGLSGADRLGFERNYWGDAVTRDLLESMVRQVPEGARVDVTPVLQRFQLDDIVEQSPIVRRHGIRLVPYDAERDRDTRYLLLFRRLADLPDALRQENPRSRLLAEVRRDGVQLAALYAWNVVPDSAAASAAASAASGPAPSARESSRLGKPDNP